MVPSAHVLGLAWLNDNHLMYTVRDKYWRPAAVKRWEIFSAKRSQHIHTEPDDSSFLEVNRTSDGKYVIMISASKTSTEVRAIPTTRDNGTKRKIGRTMLIHARAPNTQVYIDHMNGCWYAATNQAASDNLRVMRTANQSMQQPLPIDQWETVVPAQSNTRLDDVDVFQDWLVLWQRIAGLPRVVIQDIHSQESWTAPLPEYALHVEPGTNMVRIYS